MPSSDSVQKILDMLSARFGTTGTNLWYAILNYTRCYALSWMLGGSILCIVGGIYCLQLDWKEWDEGEDRSIAWGLSRGGALLCFFFAAMFIAGNLSDVLFPQASAIRVILHG